MTPAMSLDLAVRDLENYFAAWIETIDERPENARAPTPKEWGRLKARLTQLFDEAKKLREAKPAPPPIKLAEARPAEKFDAHVGTQFTPETAPRLAKGAAMDAGPGRR
jgi:hypothetical protein